VPLLSFLAPVTHPIPHERFDTPFPSTPFCYPVIERSQGSSHVYVCTCARACEQLGSAWCNGSANSLPHLSSQPQALRTVERWRVRRIRYVSRVGSTRESLATAAEVE